MDLFNARDFAAGEKLALALLERYPESGFVWLVLGTILKADGRDGLPALQKAATLLPDDADAQFNLAKTLKDIGRLDEAAAAYRRATRIRPDFAGAHNNLGNALRELGRPEEAAESYLHALRLIPDYAEAYNGLGIAYKELGRLEDAVVSYRHASRIKPDYAETYSNLGNALFALGRLEEAAASYDRALQSAPHYAEAHNGLGVTYKRMGRLSDAESSFRRALLSKPNYAEAHGNLGYALYEMGRLDEAEASYRMAVSTDPRNAEAQHSLGHILQKLARLDEAEARYRQALSLDPGLARAHGDLGSALWELGRVDEAEASYRREITLNQRDPKARSNHLFAFACSNRYSSQDFFAEAVQWETGILSADERASAQTRVFLRANRNGRRLRVGYVSADFREHAVSHFIEPVFASHDRQRVETFAFFAHGKEDAISNRLRGLVDHWQSIAYMSDESARAHIEQQQIDVLVDLSGHTAYNRLGIFARRAAPVQVHFLGFFATTGLREMDYWIADSVALPQTEDQYYSERIWRLPRVCVAYPGRDDAPAIQWQPAADGSVCLGSFNQLRKITNSSLRLWAEILHALPEATLLLKTKELELAANRRSIADAMKEHGIAPDRLELVGATPDWNSHMSLYNRLDIALDPVGNQGGCTTSCEALWMGVPVVTLMGQPIGQRMTTSILDAIEHLEWKAETESEYLDKVVALARNIELRRELRFAQRTRIANSPLCDVAALTASLEDAYEQMFDSWHKVATAAPTDPREGQGEPPLKMVTAASS
jgi:predicted O-linked N-acetylglucosamine transferase (SPINDLY family)